MKKLKPVVFVQGKYAYNAQNTTQQIMLLNALKITQDPKKLKELIGVKTVAEVYRTLDKIAMRKEYHSALAKNGITFDYIVKNIKGEIEHAEKSSDKLSALKMILQSIGMDKYTETVANSDGWEEALKQVSETKKEKGEGMPLVEYEIIEPEMPKGIKEAKEASRLKEKELYE